MFKKSMTLGSKLLKAPKRSGGLSLNDDDDQKEKKTEKKTSLFKKFNKKNDEHIQEVNEDDSEKEEKEAPRQLDINLLNKEDIELKANNVVCACGGNMEKVPNSVLYICTTCDSSVIITCPKCDLCESAMCDISENKCPVCENVIRLTSIQCNCEKKPIIKNENENEEKNYYKCGACKKIYSLILIKCFCGEVKPLNEFDKIYICSECENVRTLEEVEPAEKSKKTVKNEDINEYLNSHSLINSYCKSLTSTKEINISEENNYISSIAYIPNYAFLNKDCILTGHKNGLITLWELDDMSDIKNFKEHTGKIKSIKILNPLNYKITDDNKDNLYFITIAEDKCIKIWDSEEEEKSIYSFTSHSSILCMKIMNDKLIVANKEKELLIYKYEQKNNKFSIQLIKKGKTNHSSNINSIITLKISKGNFIISSSDKIFLHEYNNKNKSLLQKLEFNNAHKGIIYKLELVKKNKFLSCGADHVIKLWTYNMKESILALNDLVKGAIYSLQLINLISTSDEKIIVVGTEDKKMCFIKLSFKNYNNIINKLGEYTRPESVYETFYLYKNQNNLNFGTISFDKANKVYLLGKSK